MGILSKFFDSFDSTGYFLLLCSSIKFGLAWIGSKPRLVGRVSRLVLYPVKSMAGIDVEQLECYTPGAHIGAFGDRHFIVVDGVSNTLVSARTEPKLLLIKPKINDGNLELFADNIESLVINLTEVEALNKVTNGRVHGSPIVGLDCGDKAGAWIDRFLQKSGHRLLFSSSSVDKRSIRNANAKYAEWTAHVNIDEKMAYHDSSTYHILTDSSVDDLNSHIGCCQDLITVDHFRPNIVISYAEPYAEDTWVKVFIGETEFSPIKLCGRCTMTTVDPKTAKMSQEPLATLRSYRKIVPSFGDSPCMGVNLILNKQGIIRVGDSVHAVVGQPKLAP